MAVVSSRPPDEASPRLFTAAVVWVADPVARTLAEHRRGSEPRLFTASETVELPELIPGLKMLLAEIFD